MGNNKGFSLIELLVALAIGSVIVLMTSMLLIQGSTFYNRETDNVNMRNDYQVVRNQLEQAIMEAKTLVVVKADNGIVIYTGEVNPSTNELKAVEESNQTTERIITYVKDAGKIYIGNNHDTATQDGNLLCNEVTAFDIEFDPGCQKEVTLTSGTELRYVNPLQVNIDLDLKINDSSMNSSMSVKVRNVLKEIWEYNPSDTSVLLLNTTGVKYKVR